MILTLALVTGFIAGILLLAWKPILNVKIRVFIVKLLMKKDN